MIYPLGIIFGILPSFIWLMFYLKKDALPEPKKMVLKIFLFGMASAFFALFCQLILILIGKKIYIPFPLFLFLTAGLIEEFSKFLPIKFSVLKNKALDEPVDIPLYMIISALGFATVENIFLLINTQIEKIFMLTFFRFLTATFLHALLSAILGYFLVLSFLKLKNRGKIFLIGLICVSFLHWLYDLIIIKIGLFYRQNLLFEALLYFALMFLMLAVLGIIVSVFIKKIKKLKSICL